MKQNPSEKKKNNATTRSNWYELDDHRSDYKEYFSRAPYVGETNSYWEQSHVLGAI